MNIEAYITRYDLISFNFWFIFTNRIYQGLWVLVWLLTFFFSFGEASQSNVFLKAFITTVLTFLFAVFGFIFSLVFIFFTTINGKNLGWHRFTISGDGILEETTTSEMFTKWNGLVKVSKRKNYIVVQNSSATAFLIPRRSFSEKAEYDSFFEKIYSTYRENA